MASGDLSNKVAIITGASSGIGQAAAILFAKKGASIVLGGRDQERLNNVLVLCTEASGGQADRFTTVCGDVNDAEVRKLMVEKAVQTFGKLDILVPSAGVLESGDNIVDATEAIFDTLINTHVKSIFFLIQTALPHLERSGGNVVSVSSLVSTVPVRFATIYPVSKAALDHLTRCLALELGPKGIRVNAVNPSFVPSRALRSYSGDNLDKTNAFFENHEKPKHPLRGEIITVEDVANTIAFLASDAARSVTGQCHIVDGGRQFMGI